MAKAKDKGEPRSRRDDLATGEEMIKRLLDLYEDVRKGFEDQNERSNNLQEYWEIYNCQLNNQQFYSGNSKIFVPIVRDAIRARVTRFCNQIFPRSGRYIDVISGDETLPYGVMALAENYVRLAHLRTLMPALLKNGDVEGHYHVYAHWNSTKRFITSRVEKPAEIDEDTEDPDEKVEDAEVDKPVKNDHPSVEVLADSDIVVLPATADNLDAALDAGGSVTIIRRWSKAVIKKKIKEKEIDKEEGETLLAELAKDVKMGEKDKEKEMVDAAGVKRDGRGKYAQVYETWTKLPLDDEHKICRVYFAGPDKILSAKRNPLWCDRLPIISCPVDKIQGSFKGRSLLEGGVKDIQYYANDVINESADSSAYAMMPIVMTDPEKNPRVGSMVLALAAVWQTNPNDTKFAQFPPLWQDGLEIVATCRQQIFQSLSVNPSQITNQQNTKAKRNQAEIANEQQVDLMTTADAVTILEEGILTPLVTLFMEMDHQYRDKEVSIRQYGELGRMASMQSVPPLQIDHRFSFLWFGVEVARQTQQMQQQIAALNMIKSIPPQMYMGYVLDMAPAITALMESVFGPRLAPLVFRDIRYQMSSDPEQENAMMMDGIDAFVHPMDKHQEHIMTHMKGMQEAKAAGNEQALKLMQAHIVAHNMAMAAQVAAQSQQMMPKGQPGGPGGAGKGVAGTPRPGAQPGQQRPAQAPPGAIHQDRMPLAMPRRM